MKHRLSLQNIVAASAAIDPAFRDTPQYEAETLQAELGCRLVVKVETLNPIRSFKARGAQFLLSQMSGSPHLVCATAGNFGQGMAYAARKRGWPITIFVGAHANPMKVARMRGLGAAVREGSDDTDELHAEAEAFARKNGLQVIYRKEYESPRYPEMRERSPLFAALIDTLSATLNLLLPRGIDVRRGDYHVILRKP